MGPQIPHLHDARKKSSLSLMGAQEFKELCAVVRELELLHRLGLKGQADMVAAILHPPMPMDQDTCKLKK